jgi:hypothetical protein
LSIVTPTIHLLEVRLLTIEVRSFVLYATVHSSIVAFFIVICSFGTEYGMNDEPAS